MPSFRNGQWVKFSGEIAGGHVTQDGFHVGIFQRGGTDGLGQSYPDRVMVVDANGHNLIVVNDGQVGTVSFSPAELPDLAPLLEMGDMPPGRLKTAREGFVLKP